MSKAEKKDNKWLEPIFESNPESQELYAVDKTETAFYRENDADNHARENGTEYRKVTKAELEKATEKPLEKLSLKQLQAICTEKKISFEEKASKEQLIELINKAETPENA